MSHPTRLPAVIAPLLLFAFALYQGLATNNQRDFFIYRLGAELAARGENPYDIPKVRAHIARQFPDDDAREFVANSGYFLPPLAIVLYLPFAILPYGAAKVAWAAAIGVSGYFIARLPALGKGQQPRLAVWLVPFVLLLNLLTLGIVVVGQVTIIFVAAVAAGYGYFERGRPYLGAALWAIPFVKPHLAIPLVPLAWYLGGWRPALLLVALVTFLNAAGATLAGGSPLFLRDYLAFLPSARDAVAYNRVETNPQITSWNRLLFAWGGPLIELSAATTLAGYLVWFALVVGRTAAAGTRPGPAWALAAAAAGAVVCAQVLVYELLFLLAAVPWIVGLFASGWRVRGVLAVLLLAVHLAPGKVIEPIHLDRCHHALGAVLFALLVLAGPARPEEKPAIISR